MNAHAIAAFSSLAITATHLAAMPSIAAAQPSPSNPLCLPNPAREALGVTLTSATETDPVPGKVKQIVCSYANTAGSALPPTVIYFRSICPTAYRLTHAGFDFPTDFAAREQRLAGYVPVSLSSDIDAVDVVVQSGQAGGGFRVNIYANCRKIGT